MAPELDAPLKLLAAFDPAIARLQARPVSVTPRHVVNAFLESLRSRPALRDSGVLLRGEDIILDLAMCDVFTLVLGSVTGNALE
jgi:hypothetical protein